MEPVMMTEFVVCKCGCLRDAHVGLAASCRTIFPAEGPSRAKACPCRKYVPVRTMNENEYQHMLSLVRTEARKRKRDIKEVCISCGHGLGHSLNCPQIA
jgi:hypothetical protein